MEKLIKRLDFLYSEGGKRKDIDEREKFSYKGQNYRGEFDDETKEIIDSMLNEKEPFVAEIRVSVVIYKEGDHEILCNAIFEASMTKTAIFLTDFQAFERCGRLVLIFLNKMFKTVYIDVTGPSAAGFWQKMADEGLIDKNYETNSDETNYSTAKN